MACRSGMQGLVCSANEVPRLRETLGSHPLLVIPGIRPAGAAIGDQRRVATPASAIACGRQLSGGRQTRYAGNRSRAPRHARSSLKCSRKQFRAFRKSRRRNRRCKRLPERHVRDPSPVSQCALPYCISGIQCLWRYPSSWIGLRFWLLLP